MKESIIIDLFEKDGAESVALIDEQGFLVFSRGKSAEQVLSPLIQFNNDLGHGGMTTLVSENRHLIAVKLPNESLLALSYTESAKTGYFRMKIKEAAEYLSKLSI